MKISFEAIELELAKTWKISRNSSDFKTNFICQIEIDNKVFKGECAPNIRYGESLEVIRDWITKLEKIQSIENLEAFLKTHSISHSLENAVQNALLRYRANDAGEGLSSFLNFPHAKKSYKTSFSFPIMEIDELAAYYEKNNQYEVYKVKITDLKDLPFLKAIRKLTSAPIRIDANEGFSSKEDYLAFDKEISNLNIEFVEQPFPAKEYAWYQEIKELVNIPLMADESIEKEVDYNVIKDCFHMVNIKLQKCGGIKEALRLIKGAREKDLKVMLGCMIETSLGIADALELAEIVDFLDLDGSLLLKRDPYSYIKLNNGLIKLNH